MNGPPGVAIIGHGDQGMVWDPQASLVLLHGTGTWAWNGLNWLSNQRLQLFQSANSTTLLWPSATNLVLEMADTVTGPWSPVASPPNPLSISLSERAKFYRLREVGP